MGVDVAIDVEMEPVQLGIDDLEDDPVVAELDLTLQHFKDETGFSSDLYAMQFPTRPYYRPIGQHKSGEGISTVNIDKKQRVPRVGYQVANAGGQFSSSSDGHMSSTNPSSQYADLEKMYLRGDRLVSSHIQYCCGVVKDGEVRIVPIESVVGL